ncbi:hypothetical protein D9M68_992100 [compost metagenome]
MTMLPPAVVANVPGTTVRLSPSRSVSLASRSTMEVNGVSSVTVMLSSTAIGGSLAGVTLMFSVPTSVALPSVTV